MHDVLSDALTRYRAIAAGRVSFRLRAGRGYQLDRVVDVACPPVQEGTTVEHRDGVATGDGLPGGSFAARFTVDTRPELGVWANGAAFLDINGNKIWDPENADASNRDISFVYGFTSDDLFAGNFAQTGGLADGFDKLGAYGRVGTTTFRWLIDTDNDGVADVERFDPRNINGLPVAGRFDGNNANGDEVGLFTGSTWWFDTNHDFQVDVSISWPTAGHAIVGDFDGDGVDDLGTWTNDKFSFDLSSIGAPGPVAGLNNGANIRLCRRHSVPSARKTP